MLLHYTGTGSQTCIYYKNGALCSVERGNSVEFEIHRAERTSNLYSETWNSICVVASLVRAKCCLPTK